MNYHIPPLLFSSIGQAGKKQFEDLYPNQPVFKTKSDFIHIAISPSWLEEYSCPMRNIYSWAYHVHIENHNRNPIYILQKNWDILKSNGQIETIKSEILTDHAAKLNPDEACDYTTCITLDTSSNIIKGYYRISDTVKGIFNINIPSFPLDSPYNLFSIN